MQVDLNLNKGVPKENKVVYKKKLRTDEIRTARLVD